MVDLDKDTRKGKSLKSGEWITGHFSSDRYYDSSKLKHRFYINGEEINTRTVMYYQWVKDRNNIDLYEGDIIKLENGTIGEIRPNGFIEQPDKSLEVNFTVSSLNLEENLNSSINHVFPTREDMEKSEFLGNEKEGIELIKKHYNCTAIYSIRATISIYRENFDIEDKD